MRRRYIAGVVTLALAAVVAVLVLSSVGGAAVDRHARAAGCPGPGNFSPSGGKPGTWVYLNVNKAGKVVDWVYFRAKADGSFYWLEASDVVWVSNAVYARVPDDAVEEGMVTDGPMAIYSLCAGAYVPTSKNFHLRLSIHSRSTLVRAALRSRPPRS